MCKEDPERFIEKHCKVFMPHRPEKERIANFVLWPHQKRLLAELIKFGDVFSEKSRDMGISWVVMAFQLHQALFTEYFTSLNISRKENEVQDSGCTYHSLIGRVHFMYRNLPPEFKLRTHTPFLTFHVLATSSVIKGESANKNAGRDTQYKFVFVDEAAHIDVFREMWKAVRSCTNSVLVNSTPPEDAQENKYVELRELTLDRGGFKVMKFHWSEHPLKDEGWFKKKTATMTEEEVNQELEIKYDRTKSEKSYIEWSDDIHRSSRNFYYNPKHPLILGFDFGLEGEVIEFLQQDEKDRLFMLWCYEQKNLLTQEHYRNFLKILQDIRYTGKISDILAIGDHHHGHRRDRTSKRSVIEEYSAVSGGHLIIRTKNIGTNEEKRRTIKTVLKARVDGLPKIQVSSRCDKFSKAIAYSHLNRQGTDHNDDWSTHKVNAFEYVVCWLYPLLSGEMINISVDSLGNVDGVEENKEENKEKNKEKPQAEMPGVVRPYSVHLQKVLSTHRIPRRSSIWR